MNTETRKSINDMLSAFVFLNKYSWPVLRHEVIFLFVVYLSETYQTGLKAGEVTKVLKRGREIKQSDRNKTWAAGKRLVKRGYLHSLKVGYYQTTPRGREYVRSAIRDLLKYDL